MSPRKYDGARELSRVSGLTTTEVQAIWAAVKENGKRLDSCEGPHDFALVDPDAPINRREHRCTRCGGMVDGIARRWYEDGLKHARRERETP